MRKSLLVGTVGAAVSAAVVSRWKPRLQLHQCDWSVYEEGSARRSYRSLSHFLYHLRELLSVQVPITEVYLMRAISPAFRERIMLVTAYANECSW
jgi:hypothetical protein